jgi:hypothetical protein
VLYWEFTSTVDPKEETVVLWVVLGLCALLFVLVGAGIVWFVRQWRKAGQFDDGGIEVDDVMGGEYDELADEFVARAAREGSGTPNWRRPRRISPRTGSSGKAGSAPCTGGS